MSGTAKCPSGSVYSLPEEKPPHLGPHMPESDKFLLILSSRVPLQTTDRTTAIRSTSAASLSISLILIILLNIIPNLFNQPQVLLVQRRNEGNIREEEIARTEPRNLRSSFMEQMEVENRKKSQELKHLGFVRVAAIHALVCISSLYDYAKRNSGPLRSTVGTVEGAVTAVVAPVYEKFKGVPADLLVFLDEKVDEASHKFDEHAPPLAKKIACGAHGLIEIASEKVQRLVHEAQSGGPRAALHYASAETKHLLLSQGVFVWVRLNEIPPLHRAAELAVPTAAHWSKKYNHTIEEMSRKGYPVFGYLPLVPVDEIAKALKQAEKKEGEITVHESSSDSD